MYKKVLVPLDGSPFSECVLEHVKIMAAGFKIPDVKLVFVIEPVNPGMYEVPGNFIEDMQKQAVAAGEEYLKKTTAKLVAEGIAASWVVLRGNVAESILDYARKNEIDLVIMSTHGRSGIARWAMGSVADRVARQATVPVMLVSPPGCRIS
jgi:nucleotide-binding universal stress UspA family protein